MPRTKPGNRFTALSARVGRVPDWLWAPLAAALIILCVGLLALWVGQPWLFPSLGPTALMQAHVPTHRTARIYNVVIGHIMGITAGVLGVLVAGARLDPAVTLTHMLLPAQIWAAVIAVIATLLLQEAARASHPPAASTALLIAVGGFHVTVRDMMIILAGVLLVGLIGEPLRRLRSG